MALPENIGDREYQKFLKDNLGNPAARVTITHPQGEPTLDSFGRKRISRSVAIFESKQLNDNQPLRWDDVEVSGSGTTSTHSSDKCSTTLAVTLNTAGKRVRQTFRRFNYEPGKSQLIVITGQLINDDDDLAGIVSNMGAFDDDNGIFFSLDQGVMNLVLRSKVTGSAVDTKIAQTDWNIDKLDGTGTSGVTLDPTKVQIFILDYQWLGAGRVRFGMDFSGIATYIHEIKNANNIANTYMSTANLPLRFEIENLGTGPAVSMQQICGAVISEGGQERIGQNFSISNNTTEITATTGGVYYALLGIRLKSTHLDSTIIPQSVNIIITSAGNFEWQLRVDPTVAGTFIYNDVTNAAFQKATGATANTVTLGTIAVSGYGSSTGSGGSAGGNIAKILERLIIGSKIDGTPQELVLCVAGVANGETFLGGIDILEID
jgi:hypothetical protein